MAEALGWAAFFGSLIGTLILIGERGYHNGLRAAWFLATLAIPGWFIVQFRSITLDAVTGVGLAVLLSTLVRPPSAVRVRWVLTDLLMGAIVLSAIISDAFNRILIPGTVVDLVRTWVFPYLVGRVCVESWDRMDRTLRLVVGLSAVVCVFALIEAVMHVNVLAVASGKSWELLDKGEGFRWGLKRAQGSTNHPIYFGLLIALTLPWLMFAGRSASRGEAPRWWAAVPIVAAAAAFVTVSRSAHLAILIVFMADLFFRRPTLRPAMILVAAVGGLLFLIFREQILDWLGAYAGEIEVGQDKVIIYGVEYEYTGTRHRDLLLLAYEDAVDHAGWLGYGTGLQDMPRDPFMDVRFQSFDHHYLLHYLKYGYLGTAMFIAFAASAAWNLGREALARDGEWSELAAGFFGAFVAVAIMVRGVALHPDFGTTWLFVAGIAASLHARRRGNQVAEAETAPNITAEAPGSESRTMLTRSGD
jgi:hypothetical protein